MPEPSSDHIEFSDDVTPMEIEADESSPVASLRQWRRWYAAALLFSALFVVLSFVIPTVARVEVRLHGKRTSVYVPLLHDASPTCRTISMLFNITDGNFLNPELSSMIAAASPYNLTSCTYIPDMYLLRVTSQQTPPLFTNIRIDVLAGNSGMAWFEGTFIASRHWYAMVGGPRIIGPSEIARGLPTLALDIACWIGVITMCVQCVCLRTTRAMSLRVEMVNGGTCCAWRGRAEWTVFLSALVVVFVGLQYISSNGFLFPPSVIVDFPDQTDTPVYRGFLGTMAACAISSCVCTIISYVILQKV